MTGSSGKKLKNYSRRLKASSAVLFPPYKGPGDRKKTRAFAFLLTLKLTVTDETATISGLCAEAMLSTIRVLCLQQPALFPGHAWASVQNAWKQ